MREKSKKLLLVFSLLAIGVITLFVGRRLLYNQIKQAVEQKILLLNEKDLHVTYDTFYIDWAYNKIVAEKIVITKNAYDSTCVYPEFLTINKVSIQGFDLITYLFNKSFDLDEISIMRPHLVVHHPSNLFKLDSAGEKRTEAIINVEHVYVSDAQIEYLDSATCTVKSKWESNAMLTNLNLLLIPGHTIDYSFAELKLDTCKILIADSQYQFDVLQSRYNTENRSLLLDTIEIIPLKSKLEFAKAIGYEIDRFEGVIPFLKFRDFKFEFQDTLALVAEKVSAQFYVKIFRDKRQPNKRIYKKLPMEALHALGFGMQFDTLTIEKSYVSYEETSPEVPNGFITFFDNLEAIALDVNNSTAVQNGRTILSAKSNVMGQGQIELNCIMPWTKNANYQARGVVKNVSMTKFNDILEPIANIKVESGKLDDLSFKFYFNNIRSDGEITLDYKDLKLISLRDDKEIEEIIKKNKWTKKDPKDYKVNPFKSFLLNTFVIKRNIDDSDSHETRNGSILFYRNTSKSVFNYMWKSVFSGIKNAYNIDKLQTKIQSRKDKKDRRKQRRERKNS